MKERDYRKVKGCAQMVLNGRSSLEGYLLEVFYENGGLSSKDSSNVNEILRKLFVKINSKKMPVSYKNYVNGGDDSNSNSNIGNVNNNNRTNSNANNSDNNNNIKSNINKVNNKSREL
jgi:hypothetical protein